MNQAGQTNSKPIIRAFLGGTAVAFAMVGITLLWISSQSNVKTIPKVINSLPEKVIQLPASNPEPTAAQSVSSSESVFSNTPKKVKSLSIETKAE